MEIKTRLLKLANGKFVVRWIDPFNGREKQQATKTADYEKAISFAAEHKKKLMSGQPIVPNMITWEQLRERFDHDRMPGMKPGTRNAYDGTLNIFERTMKPHLLEKIDTASISRFRSILYEDKLRDETIIKHLRTMKAVLNWAVKIGLSTKMPYFEMPKRARGAKLMKGRPLADEEFKQMLAVVPDVVPHNETEQWREFLKGLWWSGLRLNEALNLYWDRTDKIQIVLTGKCPTIRIPGDLQKNGSDYIGPLAPEFVAQLQAIPNEERYGRVFKNDFFNRIREADWKEKSSRLIGMIGKKAGVIVAKDTRTGKEKNASAHDLRRSFGERWSHRVFPQILKELMRHENIATTMNYYVGRNAEKLYSVLQAAVTSEKAAIYTGDEKSDDLFQVAR